MLVTDRHRQINKFLKKNTLRLNFGMMLGMSLRVSFQLTCCLNIIRLVIHLRLHRTEEVQAVPV